MANRMLRHGYCRQRYCQGKLVEKQVSFFILPKQNYQNIGIKIIITKPLTIDANESKIHFEPVH